jgi:hypothetical protein
VGGEQGCDLDPRGFTRRPYIATEVCDHRPGGHDGGGAQAAPEGGHFATICSDGAQTAEEAGGALFWTGLGYAHIFVTWLRWVVMV